MPCPAVRINLRIGSLGQDPVRPPTVLRRGGPVNRVTYQRVTESHPRPELDQPQYFSLTSRHDD
jgi:hypothetical protein